MPIQLFNKQKELTVNNILSRASEMGSPTNPPWASGSDKTRGQGSFVPLTGGLDLWGSLQLAEDRTFEPPSTKMVSLARHNI